MILVSIILHHFFKKKAGARLSGSRSGYELVSLVCALLRMGYGEWSTYTSSANTLVALSYRFKRLLSDVFNIFEFLSFGLSDPQVIENLGMAWSTSGRTTVIIRK